MKIRYLITAGVFISVLLIGMSSYLYIYMSAYFNFFLFRKNSVSVPQNPEIPEVITKITGLFGLLHEQTIALLVSVVVFMLCLLVGIYLSLATNSPRALLNEKR
jgi:hypothetical protein